MAGVQLSPRSPLSAAGTARAFLHLQFFKNLNSCKGFCGFSPFSSLRLLFCTLTALRFSASAAAGLCSLYSLPFSPLITTLFDFCFLIYIFPDIFLTFSLSLIALSNALCSFSLSPKSDFSVFFHFSQPCAFSLFSSIHPIFIFPLPSSEYAIIVEFST